VDRIYVVDDGSTDRTAEIVQKCASEDPRIVCVQHRRNGGVGSAIYTGYKKALQENMDIVAVMAGDNQMDPRFLPHLFDPIVWRKADYTKGNRLFSAEYRKGMSAWRSFGNSVLTFLTKVASGYWDIMDPQNGYTAISWKALRTLDLDSLYTGYGYCNDILVKLNAHDFRVMDVVHPARYGREKSKIRYGSYIVRVSRLLASDFLWRMKTKYASRGLYSIPFVYASGIVLTLGGAGGAVYALYQTFARNGDFVISGGLALIGFFIGLQFLFLAILLDNQQKSRWESTINPRERVHSMRRSTASRHGGADDGYE